MTMRASRSLPAFLAFVALVAAPGLGEAATRLRIMPPDRSDFAVGQRFDIRVEATSDEGRDAAPPRGLRVFIGATEITARNILAAPGEAGGQDGTARAAANTTNFLLRGHFFARPGQYQLRATTADGASTSVTLRVHAWQTTRAGAPRARNVLFFLGDGMGAAHRTAARLVSRGIRDGKALAPLAMDTLEITGQVMTPSLNAAITDSAPGMSSYSTGQKGNNNQEGVYPDNTADPFDNPRVEYLGEVLRRTRGRRFNVGIVTTADVTDATPGANAVHTANRSAGAGIAARFFDERATNGVAVLMGGGSRHFIPKAAGGVREDGRQLADEFAAAGYTRVGTRTEVQALLARRAVPSKLLGLFTPSHLSVAFDKVGAGRYSSELALEKNAAVRDQPMLDELTRLAIRSLSASSPAGFYLLVEGASIDKQAHAADAERMIWDTIEFDNAVRAGLEFADRTNRDADPTNDTLVIVTADHETGDLGIVGVGNERYAPTTFGEAVRDYAAVFRFAADQQLDFVPNYKPDAQGFPIDPDPSRKLLLAWGAAPDRYENWLSNRLAQDAAVSQTMENTRGPAGTVDKTRVAVANPRRDGSAADSDNTSVGGVAVPGFLVSGVIENGAHGCLGRPECPADTSSEGHTFSGHTASDVPLSATGPGALQFTGTYDNTDVFVKILRSTMGSYPSGVPRRR
jgi:alkaline phosphatase